MKLVLALLLVLSSPFPPAERGGGGGIQGRRQGGPPVVYRTEVPVHDYDMVVGRVTKTSATVSVLCYTDSEGSLVYGSAPGKLTKSLPRTKFPKGEPVVLELKGLAPGARVYWQVKFEKSASPERSFVTTRPAGSPMAFSIQADSHLDGGSVQAVYLRSLAAMRDTDFMVDLGDTFMTDKYPNFKDAHAQYIAQRYYFDQAHVPVLMVPGNHDGERGADREMASWSQQERLRYFPSAPENHWAYESGDALLIGLDPYGHTTNRPRRGGQNGNGGANEITDNWYVTLGKEQYDWLKKTLETSKAKWKFVFIHNLVGGLGRDGRGGAEAAPLWEWGGKSADGTDAFKEKRPGWDAPIHQLLLKNKVSAVFHGHDHLFAHQEVDGIIYQCVPQPSHGRGGGSRSAEEYGYKQGKMLDGSGIIKLSVTPQKASFTFVRTENGEASKAFSHEFTKK
ncbi:MAG: metallophosphoesterase [Armatimonadetes bacterium]|nr:metallophosphoesterase [Armatimonadota bacterium]